MSNPDETHKKNAQTVVVLGASDRPDRYSNKAVRMLMRFGHRIIPVHPRLDAIEDIPVVHALDAIRNHVDTLTLYLGPNRSATLADAIVALKPDRVILNPGTESPELEARLESSGIAMIKACTLVMLQSCQF